MACGALRELAPKIAEIKRIYVRADHRGPGFGPRLTQALLDRAQELGYERVRVDTLPTMTAAIQFYQAMGFAPTTPYWPHPASGALFFEYRFDQAEFEIWRTPRGKLGQSGKRLELTVCNVS